MLSLPDLKERRRHHENPLVGKHGSTQTRARLIALGQSEGMKEKPVGSDQQASFDIYRFCNNSFNQNRTGFQLKKKNVEHFQFRRI